PPAVDCALVTRESRPVVGSTLKTVTSPQDVTVGPSISVQLLEVALLPVTELLSGASWSSTIRYPPVESAIRRKGLMPCVKNCAWNVRMPFPPTANWLMFGFVQGSLAVQLSLPSLFTPRFRT